MKIRGMAVGWGGGRESYRGDRERTLRQVAEREIRRRNCIPDRWSEGKSEFIQEDKFNGTCSPLPIFVCLLLLFFLASIPDNSRLACHLQCKPSQRKGIINYALHAASTQQWRRARFWDNRSNVEADLLPIEKHVHTHVYMEEL
jgi:hypothetical protein